MSRRPKRTLLEWVTYYGLTVERTDGLSPNVAGYLDPHKDARFIMINRNLPLSEQNFTIAHELAHYVRHHGRCRFPMIALLVKSLSLISFFKWARNAADGLRRFVRGLLEMEANLMAMCRLINCDAKDDIQDYLKRHPEKKRLFLFSKCAIAAARFDKFINP